MRVPWCDVCIDSSPVAVMSPAHLGTGGGDNEAVDGRAREAQSERGIRHEGSHTVFQPYKCVGIRG